MTEIEIYYYLVLPAINLNTAGRNTAEYEQWNYWNDANTLLSTFIPSPMNHKRMVGRYELDSKLL